MNRDYILVDKNQEAKNLQNDNEGFAIFENQSKSKFKFNNQSNTDLKSSPQVIKEKLGIKRQSRPNPKQFTDTVAGQQ